MVLWGEMGNSGNVGFLGALNISLFQLDTNAIKLYHQNVSECLTKARRKPLRSLSPQLGDEKGDGGSGLLEKLESRRVVEGLETLLVDADHTISFLEREQVKKVVKMYEDIKRHLKTSIDNAGHVPIDPVHVDPAGSSSNLYTKSTLEVGDCSILSICSSFVQ